MPPPPARARRSARVRSRRPARPGWRSGAQGAFGRRLCNRRRRRRERRHVLSGHLFSGLCRFFSTIGVATWRRAGQALLHCSGKGAGRRNAFVLILLDTEPRSRHTFPPGAGGAAAAVADPAGPAGRRERREEAARRHAFGNGYCGISMRLYAVVARRSPGRPRGRRGRRRLYGRVICSRNLCSREFGGGSRASPRLLLACVAEGRQPARNQALRCFPWGNGWHWTGRSPGGSIR